MNAASWHVERRLGEGAEAVVDLVGRTLDEVVGHPISEFVAPEHLPATLERFRRRMRKEPVPAQYEIELMRKDGARVPVEVAPAIVHYQGGPASQTVLRDLRGRKELELRLMHSTRIAAIGELASGIAHQLNNPMIGILNMAQILAEKIPPEDPRRKLADHIVHAGDICDPAILEAH